MALILQSTSGIDSVYIRVAIGAAVYGVLMVLARIVTLHEIKALARTWLPQRTQPATSRTESAPRTLSTAATGNES
jgi:hypothetical protein